MLQNAKIFVRISQTFSLFFSQNFTIFRENKRNKKNAQTMRYILFFLGKMRKFRKIFSGKKIRENHKCLQLLRKKSCGILCCDSSVIEVLLCLFINNFSYFTLKNVWWREFDFSSYLFKFLSVNMCTPMYSRYFRLFFS